MADEFDLILEAEKTERNYWRDLWRYRELFLFLAWRDILVRYKQTIIGIAWCVIRPTLTMLVMVFVFGKIAKLPSGGVPYPILVFSGILPWQFFSNSVTSASASLIGNREMISKIYFPRLIIPASNLIVNLLDFAISFGILFLIMSYYSFIPSLRMIFLPLFIILAAAISIGPGILIASLNVRYRDFAHVVPFLIQFGLYISPVAYGIEIVPEKWQLLYALNPIVGIINGFRWCIIGRNMVLYWPALISSIVISAIILYTAIKYFRATEKTFADKI